MRVKKYFIFVHKNKYADRNIEKIKKSGKFQFNRRIKDDMPRLGDIILFYASRRRKGYFKDTATITREIHELVGMPRGRRGTRHEINFKILTEWEEAMPWTKGLRKRLHWMRGIKEYWEVGLRFKDKAIIQIDKHDFDIIRPEEK